MKRNEDELLKDAETYLWDYIKEHKRWPRYNVFAAAMGVNHDKIAIIIRKLEQVGVVKTTTHGHYLVDYKGDYTFEARITPAAQLELVKEVDWQKEKVREVRSDWRAKAMVQEYKAKQLQKEVKVAKKSMPFVPGTIPTPLFFLKAILFLVGASATGMSIYHSRLFLLDWYGGFTATVASITMVLFAVSAFNLVAYIQTHHKNMATFARGGLTFIFIALWGIVTIFSMVSTIGGLYNSDAYERIEAKKLELKNQKTNTYSEEEYNLLAREVEIADKDLKAILERREDLSYQLKYWDKNDVGSYSWKTVNYKLTLADREAETVREYFKEVNARLKNYIEKGEERAEKIEVVDDSFYIWVTQSVFGTLSPDRFRFWLSVFPAVFYDIMAPLALAVVLWFGRKKEEN